MLDHGDMVINCALLPEQSSVTTFHSFYTPWILYFDSPCFTVVDAGSNLASTDMQNNLRSLQSQLDYNTGPNHTILLSPVNIASNLTLHVSNTLPHYHRFGIMPRAFGSIDTLCQHSERHRHMMTARELTAQSRAHGLLWSVNIPQKRSLTTLRHLVINENVWFQRFLHA